MNVTVDIDIATWIPQSVIGELQQSIEFFCTRKGGGVSETGKSQQRTLYAWSGHTRKALKGDHQKQQQQQHHSHKARLLFLEEGEYIVSACMSFGRVGGGNDSNAKEIWWAEKACIVQVVAPVPINKKK